MLVEIDVNGKLDVNDIQKAISFLIGNDCLDFVADMADKTAKAVNDSSMVKPSHMLQKFNREQLGLRLV